MTTTDPKQEAEAALLRKSLPIVHRMAFRMHRRLGIVEIEELISVGMLTLHDTMRRYDPGLGSFSHYLHQRLNWAMSSAARKRTKRFNARRGLPAGVASRYLHDRARPIRVTPMQGDTILPSLHELRGKSCPGTMTVAGDLSETAINAEASPEVLVTHQQTGRTLRSAVEQLPPVECKVLSLHYFAGEPFTEIARVLDVTRARVSQLHRKGLGRCANILRRRGLDREMLGTRC